MMILMMMIYYQKTVKKNMQNKKQRSTPKNSLNQPHPPSLHSPAAKPCAKLQDCPSGWMISEGSGERAMRKTSQGREEPSEIWKEKQMVKEPTLGQSPEL
jgi:hypothetical protein